MTGLQKVATSLSPRADCGEMKNPNQFGARNGQRHNGFDSAPLPAVADAAAHGKIDEVLRAAYKKFGRGKLIQKAVALGLRKHRRTA